MAQRINKKSAAPPEGQRSPLVPVLVFAGALVLVFGAMFVHKKMQIRGWVRDLGAEQWGIRKDAYDHLLAMGKKAVPYVAQALKDKTGAGLAAAAQLAGRLGDASVAPRLIELLSDSDRGVRQSAAAALGDLKASASVDPLIALLDDAAPEVKRSAALALARIGKDAAAAGPKLLKLLGAGTEPVTVRTACAVALGSIGDESAVTPLVNLLNPTSFELAKAAAAALGTLGSAKAVGPLCNFLTQGIPDSEGRNVSPESVPPDLRVLAIAALEKIGDRGAVPTLKRCADPTVTTSYLVQEAAKKALQKMGQ